MPSTRSPRTARDLHGEEAVIEQDPGARANVAGQGGVRRGDFIAARPGLRREDHPGARLELPRLGQRPDPDPRTVQVQQDRRRLGAPSDDILERPDPDAPKLGGAMGGVDPDDVDAGIEEFPHAIRGGPRGAKGSDDLRAANAAARHAVLSGKRECGKRESNRIRSRPHHRNPSDHRQDRTPATEGLAVPAFSEGIDRPRHQIGILARREGAAPLSDA